MEHLNYHHLRLFWAVAREGNLTRASRGLHLTPQTVSAQIRELEGAVGERLFRRAGRKLLLTEVGRLVLRYADEIFALGAELRQTLSGSPSTQPLRLLVGVLDVLPKLVACRLLEPALRLDEPLALVCREGPSEKLLAGLAVNELDVVLADHPVPTGLGVQAYSHLLGECGITFMAPAPLARRLRRGFPESLDRAPALLPTEEMAFRRELDRWFDARGLHPMVVGEFEDSALMKTFGFVGAGFFAVPSVIAQEVARQFSVRPVGSADGAVARFFALSVERQVRHPAVAAICDSARSVLFPEPADQPSRRHSM